VFTKSKATVPKLEYSGAGLKFNGAPMLILSTSNEIQRRAYNDPINVE
jgi:hypothetical protein